LDTNRQTNKQTNTQTDKPNLYIDCSLNEIIPENPQFKNQKSSNTVIPTMSRVLHAFITQQGKPSLVDINNFS